MPKVWINNNTLFDKLVVIADEAIISADVDEGSQDETRTRIENGNRRLSPR